MLTLLHNNNVITLGLFIIIGKNSFSLEKAILYKQIKLWQGGEKRFPSRVASQVVSQFAARFLTNSSVLVSGDRIDLRAKTYSRFNDSMPSILNIERDDTTVFPMEGYITDRRHPFRHAPLLATPTEVPFGFAFPRGFWQHLIYST